MNDQVHIDTATLDMLQDILDDGFAGLLDTYIDDSNQKIESLKEGLNEADSDKVRRSAHSLKGSSSNLGANPMAELCLCVEQRARDGSLDGLDDIVVQIEAEHRTVVGIMEGIKKSL